MSFFLAVSRKKSLRGEDKILEGAERLLLRFRRKLEEEGMLARELGQGGKVDAQLSRGLGHVGLQGDGA